MAKFIVVRLEMIDVQGQYRARRANRGCRDGRINAFRQSSTIGQPRQRVEICDFNQSGVLFFQVRLHVQNMPGNCQPHR